MIANGDVIKHIQTRTDIGEPIVMQIICNKIGIIINKYAHSPNK